MNKLSKEDRAKVAESNKLIAEFMGKDVLVTTKGRKQNVSFMTEVETIGDYLNDQYNVFMPYHTSWDWLMPVVEKIHRETNGYVTIKDMYCQIHSAHPNEMEIIEFEGLSTIDATYAAIIQFITWYNQNNQCIQ